jgi:alkylation response protein AidB-like acyl-CoA dehydrogenase
MDLQDTPQEAAFRAECRAWLDANAPKHLLPQLEASSFGRSAFEGEDYLKHAKEWQAKKFEQGWACITWPEAYGGRGATTMESVIWGQEEGPYRALSSAFIIGHGMCGPTLMSYATEEQKREHLPPLASGEKVWCQLFSEPEAGSDLAGLRTRSVRDGDEWVVNGQKVWTSGAHYSDWAILVTRSDFDVAKHKGLTYFFFDMKSPGIEIRPIRQAHGEAGFNEVFFTNVRIPDSQRLGNVGDGWSVAITTLMNERLAIGAGAGTGWGDLFEYANATDAVNDPAIRERLAEWYVNEMGLRYTGYRALTALSKGQMPGPENSISKIVAGNTMQLVASTALDIQDAAGIITDADQLPQDGKFPAMMLRSLGMRIEGGTDEILRNIIAERVLGLPGDIRVDRDVPFNEIPSNR